jgi:cytochrome c
MKKLFLLFAVAGIMAACGGSGNKEEKKDAAPAAEQKAEESNPLKEKAMTLIGNSDCATCHRIEEKLNGPAWKEVAKKYAGVDTAVQYLAGKIISGGGGVWGEIPMAPHTNMSMEDAKTLAEYVMTLNK